MNGAVVDINSSSIYRVQFDPDAPMTKLEGLLEGDSEICAEQFVDWLADEKRGELYQLIVDRLGADDVRQLAAMWAEQEGGL
ncbi:MAG TPA: hypothetical protein VFM75_02040 [Modicisalibacter sp.]|nr:hypothetical protein [Modicisalibacter sp.]